MKRIVFLLLCIALSPLVSNAQAPQFDENPTYILGKETIWDVDFSPDGKTIVAASSHKRLIFWSPFDGKIKRSVDVGESALFTGDYNHDGSKVVAGCWTGGFYVVDASTGKVLGNHATDVSVNGADAHPSKDIVLLAGSEKYPKPDYLRSYDMNTGEKLVTFYEGPGSKEFPGAVAWSNDGSEVACGMVNKNKILRIYDAETGKNVRSKQMDFDISDLDWSSDGKYIVTGGGDEQVKLWDAKSLELIWSAPWNDERCSAVKFSPDGQYIAAGGRGYEGHYVRIYRTSDGEIMQSIGEKNPVMNSVAWGPQGQAVALAATVYGDFAEVAIARVHKTMDFGKQTANTSSTETNDNTENNESEADESAGSWYEYVNTKAELEALLPKAPKTDEEEMDKNGRPKYKVETSSSTAFTLIIATTVKGKVSEKNQYKVADNVAKKFFSKMGVEPDKKTTIESPKGIKGVDAVFYKDGLRYRYLSYAKGKHAYQAFYLTKNTSASADEEKFIRHFSPQ